MVVSKLVRQSNHILHPLLPPLSTTSQIVPILYSCLILNMQYIIWLTFWRACYIRTHIRDPLVYMWHCCFFYFICILSVFFMFHVLVCVLSCLNKRILIDWLIGQWENAYWFPVTITVLRVPPSSHMTSVRLQPSRKFIRPIKWQNITVCYCTALVANQFLITEFRHCGDIRLSCRLIS